MSTERTDRQEVADRTMTTAEVRELLDLASDDAARSWLTKHGIRAVTGFPADEVREAFANRPGRGNWKRR